MKNTIEKEYNDQISQEEEAVQTADEYVEPMSKWNYIRHWIIMVSGIVMTVVVLLMGNIVPAIMILIGSILFYPKFLNKYRPLKRMGIRFVAILLMCIAAAMMG